MRESDAARIQSLVHPLPMQEFLGDCWPGRFQHFTGDPARLADLIQQPEFHDIAALVRCPQQGMIRADYTREDRPSESNLSAERAQQLYGQACTIYMTGLSTTPLRNWTRALDSTLGLLPGTAKINAFASLPGKGLNWHWDSQEIFIVQVRGRKLWHVAPNEYIEWPATNGAAGAERRAELRMQLFDPTRAVEEPKQWTSIELTPGSVLFLPRGYWHTTENIDASLHLVLQVKMPSWRDVLQFMLQSVPELYSVPWRRPTKGLHPVNLMTSGLREFRERCDALSAFTTPEKVTALLQAFQSANSNGMRAGAE